MVGASRSSSVVEADGGVAGCLGGDAWPHPRTPTPPPCAHPGRSRCQRRAHEAGCNLARLMSGRRPEREAAHLLLRTRVEDARSHRAFYAKDL